MHDANAVMWDRTPTRMVESVLRAHWGRLAASYRKRLVDLLGDIKAERKGLKVKTTSFPQLAASLARKIGPTLHALPAVEDEYSFNAAFNAIDEALTSQDILIKGQDRHVWTDFSGPEIHRLMRLHDVSIVDLARRLGVTQKRVRHVRLNGVTGNAYCRDWYEAITRYESALAA